MVNHTIKWESAGLIDRYYVVGVTIIPYIGFRVTINIVSKEGVTYHVTLGNIPQCICPDFTKTFSYVLGREMGVLQTPLQCV